MSDKIMSPSSGQLQPEAKPHPGEKPRPLIAVIDDDEMVRGLAVSVLVRVGKIVTATNGRDGVELYAEYTPDLVFLDINMPLMSGLEVLKQIIAMDQQAKVIMFSSRSTGPNIAAAMKIGAKGFITKPFTADILEERTAHIFSALHAE
jgi:two-component system chemotaxis response regulator CheY